MSTALNEAYEAFRRASECVRHALSVEVCRLLGAVDAQLDRLQQLRRELERKGLPQDLVAQLNGLEADFEAIRARLEAE